jgi:hypothetical protein
VRKAVRVLRGGAITISSILATMTPLGAVVACVLIAALVGLTLLVLLNKTANRNLIRIMKARRPKVIEQQTKRGK